MNIQTLQELVRNYQPDYTVLGGLSNVSLIMVVGPSGVGKTTVIQSSGIPQVIGDASREPREGEVDGVDYNFRTLDEMIRESVDGRYVQLALGSEGDLKATHATSFPSKGTAIFAVAAAAVPTFRSLPFASTKTIILVPPSYDEWLERVGAHHTAADKMALRLDEARKSYTFALQDKASIFVMNDDLQQTVAQVNRIAAGEAPVNQAPCRAVVQDILEKLGS